MFIINVINSIPSPNTHMVNIIFATILIIVIILSVKRTTTNGITTTRRGHFVDTISGLGCLMVLLLRVVAISWTRSLVLVLVAIVVVAIIVVAIIVVVVAVEISKREEF